MDVVDQINALFPTEQSLSQLDSVMHSVEDEVVSLDCELAKLVEMHGKAGAEGDQALHEVYCSLISSTVIYALSKIKSNALNFNFLQIC